MKVVQADRCVVASRPLDLCLATFYADFLDPAAFLPPMFASANAGVGGSNLAGYRNAAIDEAMRKAAQMPLGPARTATWRRIETRVLRRVPVVPILFNDFHQIHSADVQGVVDRTLGYFDLTATHRS